MLFAQFAPNPDAAVDPDQSSAIDPARIVLIPLWRIELRLLAHFSEDRLLVEAFRRGDDIHTLTASQVFGQIEREKGLDVLLHRQPPDRKKDRRRQIYRGALARAE